MRLAAPFRRLVSFESDCVFTCLKDLTLEALALCNQNRCFNAGLVTRPVFEIGLSDQRPVDAGGGDFQMISLVYRIFDVERRRHSAADLLAIFDSHGSVLALSHDLQGQAILAGQPHANETEADCPKHRLDDRSYARVNTALADDTVVAYAFAC